MKLSTIVRVLSTITSNPYVNLLTATALFASAGWEIYYSIEEASIGVEHGVILLALVNILKTIPELLDGTEALERVEKEKASQTQR